MKIEEIISRAQPWIEWLENKGKLTLEEFIEEVEFYCQAPVICGATDILDATTTGISLRKGDKYYIAYDEKLPETLVEQTKIHELVHILLGDVDAQERIAMRSGLDQIRQQIRCKLNVHFDKDNEELVEYLADCFAERLILKKAISLNETMKNWFNR
jgi:hypothetical protein